MLWPSMVGTTTRWSMWDPLNHRRLSLPRQAGVILYGRGQFDREMQAFFARAAGRFPGDEFFLYMAALAAAAFVRH